jgi:hypothetical protein
MRGRLLGLVAAFAVTFAAAEAFDLPDVAIVVIGIVLGVVCTLGGISYDDARGTR